MYNKKYNKIYKLRKKLKKEETNKLILKFLLASPSLNKKVKFNLRLNFKFSSIVRSHGISKYDYNRKHVLKVFGMSRGILFKEFSKGYIMGLKKGSW